MCGRFTVTVSMEELEDYYNASRASNFQPSYNIAPQTNIPVVIQPDQNRPEILLFKWGLIPSWSKDPKIGYKLINARAESILEKPSFKSSFTKRRCIIPASGFYEWHAQTKEPYYIKPKKGLFSFAGIWDRWQDMNGIIVRSCAIITTAANSFLTSIHERVPVHLDQSEIQDWLNPNTEINILKSILHTFQDEEIEFWRVSKLVNSPKNNNPDLIQRLN